MSIIGRSNGFDPSIVNLDPFEDSNLPFPRSGLYEKNTFLGALVDWKESREAHEFTADLPGLKKEEVIVEVEEESVLKISGVRKRDKEEKIDTLLLVECSNDSFIRRLQLPEKTKADGVKATMENGVLTVTVHKEEVKKPVLTIDNCSLGDR